MTKNKFWERVNSLIRINNTTQVEAAAACGVNKRTFQNWIQRGLYPTIIDGYYLAGFLGVSVEFLVTGRETKTTKQVEMARSRLLKTYIDLKKVRG